LVAGNGTGATKNASPAGPAVVAAVAGAVAAVVVWVVAAVEAGNAAGIVVVTATGARGRLLVAEPEPPPLLHAVSAIAATVSPATTRAGVALR
jgi:hypothetical protein